MKTKWFKPTLLVLLIAVLLTACGGEPTPTASSGAPGSASSTPASGSAANDPTTPEAAGRVRIAQWNAPTGLFHPELLTSDYDSSVTGLIFESLVEFSPDFEYVPELAESWEISADNLSVTFKLKECNWHDGTPFTAEDVVFSFGFVGHPDYDGPRYSNIDKIVGMEEYHKGEADTITGIEIIDERTVKITTVEPYAPFLYSIGGRAIIPKHIWEGSSVSTKGVQENNADILLNPIGTGPFIFESFVADSHVILNANPDYHEGAPKVPGVIIQAVSQSTAMAQIIRGEVDMIDLSDFNPDGLKQLTDAQVQVVTAPLVAVQYMGINHRQERFQVTEVRQALMHAIDRQGIVDNLYYGQANVANNPFPKTNWACPPDEDLKPYEYNPEEAIRLLTSVGYTFDADKVVLSDPEGNPVEWTLKYPSGNKAREDYAVVIQANLKDIGITLNLDIMEFATLSTAAQTGDFDLFLMGMGTSFDGDQKYIWGTGAQFNYAGWADETTDNYLEEGLKYLDQERRKEVYGEWAVYMNEEVPNVWLLNWNGGMALAPNLQNVRYFAGGSYSGCWNWEFTK